MKLLGLKITISVLIIVGPLVFGICRDFRGQLWASAGVTSGAVTREYSRCIRNCQTWNNEPLTAKSVDVSVGSGVLKKSVTYEDTGDIEVNTGFAANLPVGSRMAAVEFSVMTPVYSTDRSELRDVWNQKARPALTRVFNSPQEKVTASKAEYGPVKMKNYQWALIHNSVPQSVLSANNSRIATSKFDQLR